MTAGFPESVVEHATLVWLDSIDWQVAHGPEIAPEMPVAELSIAETEPTLRPSSCSTPQVEEKRPQ